MLEKDLAERVKLPTASNYQIKIFEAVQKSVDILLSGGKPQSIMIDAKPGSGKCLGKGTPILMYNGDIRRVEDICVGDLLMGPDSKSREVLSLSHGWGDLFKIKPIKGDSWICNDVHMLTLSNPKGDLIDIPLIEHIRKINKNKSSEIYKNRRYDNHYKLVRVGVDFPEKKLEYDPYVIGLWIGDGTTNQANFTNVDEPIIKCKECNHLIAKQIPNDYLINSRSNRLALLAGILDSNGSLQGNCYDISTKWVELRDQILFLARSLGLSANTWKKIHRKKNGQIVIYHRINISGELSDIPVLLSRKKAHNCTQIKNVGHVGWSTEYIGQGEYFGFELNEDGRFLLGDFTITHNTTTGVAAARLIPNEISSIFLAFNKKIADELVKRLPLGFPAKTFHSFWFRQWSQHCWNLHRSSCTINDFKIKNAVEKFLGIDKFERRTKKMSESRIAEIKKAKERCEDICFLVEKAKIFGVVPRGYNYAKSVTMFDDNFDFWNYIMDYYNHHIDEDDFDEDLDIARNILRDGLDNELEIDFNDMMYMPAVKGSICEKYQIVMIDEAQDLNMLQQYLLTRMIDVNGMIIAIGDPCQCQPTGTMISIPGEYTGSRSNKIQPKQIPIENLKVGDKLVSYSTKKSNFTGITQQSGVYVEDIASRKYTGYLYSVIAENNITQGTDNHRWLVRFNKEAKDYYCVYLMRRGNRFRVGMCKLLHKRSFEPGQRARDEKADSVYILAIHKNKNLILDLERIIAHNRIHSIPDVVFESETDQNKGILEDDSNIIEIRERESEYAENFWVRYGTNYEDGIAVLKKWNRDINYPIWSKDNNDHIGLYSFVTQSTNLLNDVMSVSIFDGNVKGGKWVPIKIKKDYVENIDVFSLKVTALHDNEYRRLYVANGIVTHNSIYAFRGADTDSMSNIKKRFDCKVYPLSISYRCAKSIVDLAYSIYPEIESHPNSIDGSVEYPEKININDFSLGDLIICRNNHPIINLCYKLIRNKMPAKVIGRDIGIGLIKLIKKMDKDNSLPELITNLIKWRDRQIEIIEYKSSDDMRNKDAIIDKYECIMALCTNPEIKDVKQLIFIIDDMFTNDKEEKDLVSDKRITLSTIHKIKGGESDKVYLLDSHLINPPWVKTKSTWQQIQEENLRFVAVTRAKTRLIFISSEHIE